MMKELVVKIFGKLFEWITGKKPSSGLNIRQEASGSATQLAQNISTSGVHAVQTGNIHMGDHGTIIVGSAPTSSQGSQAENVPSITVSRVMNDLHDLPPFQRRQARKAYVGRWIEEEGRYLDAAEQIGEFAQMSVISKEGNHSIWGAISTKRFPEIRTIKEGTRLRFRGRIVAVENAGVQLDDIQIFVLGEEEPPKQIVDPSKQAERVFVRVSLVSIVAEIKDKTSFERDTVVSAKYRNKWIEEEFVMTNFSNVINPSLTLDPKVKGFSSFYIFADFDKDWFSKLSHRQVGEVLRIRGKIAEIQSYETKLVECELVE